MWEFTESKNADCTPYQMSFELLVYICIYISLFMICFIPESCGLFTVRYEICFSQCPCCRSSTRGGKRYVHHTTFRHDCFNILIVLVRVMQIVVSNNFILLFSIITIYY